MDKFSKSREQWYSAYVADNTVELKYHESENLQVTVNGQVQVADRYSAIDHQVKSGTWFQPELARNEVMREIENGYLVEGTAEIVAGKAIGAKISYSECWYYDSGAYKITRLNINA